MAQLYESRVAEMDRAAERARDEETAVAAIVGEMQTPQFRQWAEADTSEAMLAIVFTDLVGSTEMGQELGDRPAADIRSRHLDWFEALVRRYRGWVANQKGDGVVATFHRAADALDFAVAAHRDPGHEGLAIRAGIHMGSVRMEGANVFGNAVAYCARVEDHVKASGICVSDPVKQALRIDGGPASGEASWSEHRDVELKGFPGEHTLWTLLLE